MALVNPTLRDPGTTPGSAAGWTITSFCQLQRIGAFGPDPASAIEDFERWGAFATTFPAGTNVVAFFDANSEGLEDFENGWTTSAFVSAFSDALLDAYPFAGGVETLAAGWLEQPWIAAWNDVSADAGMFGNAPRDDFESWGIDQPAAWTSAAFDAAAVSAEAFAGTWAVMKSL